MKIKFARTSHDYDSYVDYWSLVALAGFPIVSVSEIDFGSSDVYIVSPWNGEVGAKLAEQRRADGRSRIVWWNLERPDPADHGPKESSLLQGLDGADGLCDEIWVSDRHYAGLDRRLRHVIMGGHVGLRMRVVVEPPLYDLAHVSYVAGRRVVPMGELGAVFRIAPGGRDPDRGIAISASRAMINIHQTPAPIGEPLRFALTAAYGLPLITEGMADPFPLVAGRDFLPLDLEDPVPQIRFYLSEQVLLTSVGKSLQRLFTEEYTFRSCVEGACARWTA